jgi:nitroreductase
MDLFPNWKDKPMNRIQSFKAEPRDAGSVSDPQSIVLPKPETDGGMSVLAALRERKTTRDISPEKLTLQLLSNLLWAACGVNRKTGAFGKPGRTAGSASNSQEIDLYIATQEGGYLYEPIPHSLTPIAAGDFRKLASWNGSTDGPVHIFYVADLTRFDLGKGQPDPSIGDPEVQKSYYYLDTGLIAQNVYLFAASHELAAWFHNCDKEKASKVFNLRPEQRVLFAQSVGYPEKR